MPDRDRVQAFIATVERGEYVEAIERFYAEDASMQENAGEPRVGRGALVAGSVEGMELADPKLNPFWAKAEQLGVLIFIHPQGTSELQASGRLKGNGVLENTIGNPLETTIALSHLIFEGTLDAYPGLKICAAHSGGYLPSYAARSDAGHRYMFRKSSGSARPQLSAGYSAAFTGNSELR